MPKITVEMFEGRTLEQKRLLAEKLTQTMVETINVDPSLVHIIIHENPKENVALAGKLFCDM